ncbi:MAG: lipid-binding SYLF domain-containing protein [Halothiobacillaceae bacterium]
MQRLFSKTLFGIFALSSVACLPTLAWAEGESDTPTSTLTNANATVNNAVKTLKDFSADPNMSWYRDNVAKSKAVFIVPEYFKAGFIFGAAGGTGVVLVRDEKSDIWRGPAFSTIGAASVGFQAGGSVAEIVMMAMTDKGRDALLSTKFQLGADASVAAGPVGTGAQAATVDIIQFARSKGLFAGVSLEGAVIAVRDSMNHAYYGTPVNPVDILVLGNVNNPHSATLIQTLTARAGR